WSIECLGSAPNRGSGVELRTSDPPQSPARFDRGRLIEVQVFGDNRRSGMNAQLFEQPMHVRVHGGCADSERGSDFLVRHAFKQASQYLLLTNRQPAFLGYQSDLVNELNQK